MGPDPVYPQNVIDTMGLLYVGQLVVIALLAVPFAMAFGGFKGIPTKRRRPVVFWCLGSAVVLMAAMVVYENVRLH